MHVVETGGWKKREVGNFWVRKFEMKLERFLSINIELKTCLLLRIGTFQLKWKISKLRFSNLKFSNFSVFATTISNYIYLLSNISSIFPTSYLQLNFLPRHFCRFHSATVSRKSRMQLLTNL